MESTSNIYQMAIINHVIIIESLVENSSEIIDEIFAEFNSNLNLMRRLEMMKSAAVILNVKISHQKPLLNFETAQ